MAEGFARAYGDDCLIAASAGLAPASMVAPDTMRAMDEKNIDLREQFPKGLRVLARAEFDLVVNMSGSFLPEQFGKAKLVEWDVADPVMMDYEEHCAGAGRDRAAGDGADPGCAAGEPSEVPGAGVGADSAVGVGE